MFEIDGIWESDKKIKIATGLSKIQVEEIFQDFQEELSKRHNLRDRPNKLGRLSSLTSKELFLMILIFLRHYPTFEFLSLIFNLDTANVKRWVDSSFKALGVVLVKKNFAHLMCLNQKRYLESDLSNSEKYILMELNKIYEDQKTL